MIGDSDWRARLERMATNADGRRQLTEDYEVALSEVLSQLTASETELREAKAAYETSQWVAAGQLTTIATLRTELAEARAEVGRLRAGSFTNHVTVQEPPSEARRGTWNCGACGEDVEVTEQECCTHCGRDAELVLPAPSPVGQDGGEKSEESVCALRDTFCWRCERRAGHDGPCGTLAKPAPQPAVEVKHDWRCFDTADGPNIYYGSGVFCAKGPSGSLDTAEYMVTLLNEAELARTCGAVERAAKTIAEVRDFMSTNGPLPSVLAESASVQPALSHPEPQGASDYPDRLTMWKMFGRFPAVHSTDRLCATSDPPRDYVLASKLDEALDTLAALVNAVPGDWSGVRHMAEFADAVRLLAGRR